MRRTRSFALWGPLGIVAALAADCGKNAPSPEELARAAAASARLAVPVAFQPPADGLLTDSQIDRYIRVRRAAKGSTDAEAARAVGVDPDEFAWVRARIAEALLEADRRRVRAASDEVYGKTIASLRETRRAVQDPSTTRSIDEQIVLLERERASIHRPEPLTLALAGNARRVAARRADIDASP